MFSLEDFISLLPEIFLSVSVLVATLFCLFYKNSRTITVLLLATQWVEEATGKSLLCQKWSYTHQNNILLLPNPPIVAVLEVRTKRKILAPKDFKFM